MALLRFSSAFLYAIAQLPHAHIGALLKRYRGIELDQLLRRRVFAHSHSRMVRAFARRAVHAMAGTAAGGASQAFIARSLQARGERIVVGRHAHRYICIFIYICREGLALDQRVKRVLVAFTLQGNALQHGIRVSVERTGADHRAERVNGQL